MGDRIIDPGPLQGSIELDAKASPHIVERCVERQGGKIARALAEIARSAEGIALIAEDQDLVLQLADEIVPQIELEQAIAQQRVFDARPELPGSLRLEIGIADGDPPGREVADADEIIEVELRDRPPHRQLRAPAAARLPVQSEVRLQEFEGPLRLRVAADLEA